MSTIRSATNLPELQPHTGFCLTTTLERLRGRVVQNRIVHNNSLADVVGRMVTFCLDNLSPFLPWSGNFYTHHIDCALAKTLGEEEIANFGKKGVFIADEDVIENVGGGIKLRKEIRKDSVSVLLFKDEVLLWCRRATPSGFLDVRDPAFKPRLWRPLDIRIGHFLLPQSDLDLECANERFQKALQLALE